MQLSTRIKYKKEHLPYIIFGAFFFLIQCFIIPYEGDDTYFLSTVNESNNVLSFVQMRYATWSGRLRSTGILPDRHTRYCNAWHYLRLFIY